MKVRKVGDGMMAIVLVFDDVLRPICGHVLPSGRSFDEGEWENE